MRLDHDRATGGQCRGGVTAQHGKSKGEIAGREHGHRPQWNAPPLHRGMTCGWCARHRRIIDDGTRATLFGQIGKAAQLKDCAVQLTVQTHGPQGGFSVCQGHQPFPVRFQCGGQRTQQQGALSATGRQPHLERGSRRFASGIDLGGQRRRQLAQHLA